MSRQKEKTPKDRRFRATSDQERELLEIVSSLCPLCGKPLGYYKDGCFIKNYEIAHIYPSNATPAQRRALKGLPRAEKIESFENVIPLCLDSHNHQDFHMRPDKYIRLYNRRRQLQDQRDALRDAAKQDVEEGICNVMKALAEDANVCVVRLKHRSLRVRRKISEPLLRHKVEVNVASYFDFIQGQFSALDAMSARTFRKIASQVHTAYVQAIRDTLSQDDVFAALVQWLQSKTLQDGTVCEIMISFFVQNCEVFDELPE